MLMRDLLAVADLFCFNICQVIKFAKIGHNGSNTVEHSTEKYREKHTDITVGTVAGIKSNDFQFTPTFLDVGNDNGDLDWSRLFPRPWA